MRRGLIAELPDEAALLAAVRALRARGLARLETWTPCRVEGLDEALGEHRSRIPLWTGAGALAGATGGYALQWLVDAYLYPIDSGGRPPHMPLAFVPIGVEMGFLIGALVTFVVMLVAGRLVRLWEPVQEVDGFGSATRDGMWLAVDAADPRYDAPGIIAELERAGGTHVARFGDGEIQRGAA